MINPLSTRDLIARMTPIALAEMIVSIEQGCNLDTVELHTVHLLRTSLAVNVGDAEAAKLIDAAQG